MKINYTILRFVVYSDILFVLSRNLMPESEKLIFVFRVWVLKHDTNYYNKFLIF